MWECTCFGGIAVLTQITGIKQLVCVWSIRKISKTKETGGKRLFLICAENAGIGSEVGNKNKETF